MRHVKIVCTLGPSSSDPQTVARLIAAGMDVARLNFSHGTHAEHGARIRTVREAAGQAGKPVAVLLDTQGPEIRTGDLAGGSMELQAGQTIVLTPGEEAGSGGRVPISYRNLPRVVRPGDRILIDDGLIALEVCGVTGEDVTCRVLNGGRLLPHKGVNLPGVEVDLPAVTAKDREDLAFGVAAGVDLVAASFIRSAADVHHVRRVLEEHGGGHIQVIAKIESRAGVQNLEEILRAADGLMVARGDLGVEIPAEEVPLVQKHMIALCNRAGKPVITATQMLDSMIRNPRPTRAEASDVANAVLDGTDAVMLSGETASGRYPVEAVETMCRIVERAEAALAYGREALRQPEEASTTDAIGRASCVIAAELGAAAIIASTATGSTARMVAKYRPRAPIIATSPRPEVLRQLALVWGVLPLLGEDAQGTDRLIETAVNSALAAGLIPPGALVVITAGVPVGVPGSTNLLKVHVVGEVLARGTGIGQQVASGVTRLVRSREEGERLQPGEVMVAPATDRELVDAMRRAAAVVTEEGGLTSHAAVVGLSLGIPVVVGVTDAVRRLPAGEVVTVDGRRGLIYRGLTRVL